MPSALIKTINIKDITNKKYDIYSNIDKYMYLNNEIDTNNLIYEYVGIEEINKNIKQNDKIGKVNIKNNDQILYSFDIFLDKKINYYNIKIYIIETLIILLILLRIINRKYLHKNKQYDKIKMKKL